MAYLSGYNYRKKISITGASGLGTNAQVLVKVGATSSATGEDFDLDGHAENFPNDIRFTDNDGETELDYYLEKTLGAGDSMVAWFWVEVADSLESSADIYIYYGKSAGTSASNADNTFIFAEDFEDLTTGQALAGQGGWVAAGGTSSNLTVEANQASGGSNSAENTKNGDANVYHAFTASANVGLIFHIRVSSDGAGGYPIVNLADGSGNYKTSFRVDGNADDLEYYDGSAWQDIDANYSADTYYRLEGRFRASDDNGNWRRALQTATSEGTFVGWDTQQSTWTTLARIYIFTNNSENAYFDQILIYKVATDGTAATFDSVGDEEIFAIANPVTLTLNKPTATVLGTVPINANVTLLTLTLPLLTQAVTGGYTLQSKNTASWTNLTKH